MRSDVTEQFMQEIVSTLLLLFLVCAGILLLFWGIRVLWLRTHKPREKKAATDIHLSPTLQWMNTAGSILLASNKDDFRYMGGVFAPGDEQDEKWISKIKKILWDYWQIQGQRTALEEMSHLVHTGMRRYYGEEMRHLERLYGGYSEEQLIETAKQENPKANEDSFLPKMVMAYRRYGEDALLGWDVGRCALISQWCYYVGYLDMQTMLNITVEAGEKAQAVFQNWEEMMESYLLGGQYWLREDANNPESKTAKRWKIYEALWNGWEPYNMIPYVTIPFDTPLSKEIITDQYGRMPA